MTEPRITSSIRAGFKLILSNAPFMAIAPHVVAVTDFKQPPKDPIGVLTAATINTSFDII